MYIIAGGSGVFVVAALLVLSHSHLRASNAIMHVNTSQASADQWQPSTAPRSDESKIETLLFNILTIVLAAATLVVACVHVVHQRREARDREYINDQHRNRESSASGNNRSERMYSGHTERTLTSVEGMRENADLGEIELRQIGREGIEAEASSAEVGSREIEVEKAETMSQSPGNNEHAGASAARPRWEEPEPNRYVGTNKHTELIPESNSKFVGTICEVGEYSHDMPQEERHLSVDHISGNDSP